MEVCGLWHRGQDFPHVVLVNAHHQEWTIALRDRMEDDQMCEDWQDHTRVQPG